MKVTAKVTATEASAARSLAELIEAARQANCGQCWAGPEQPCVTPGPEGIHVARFARAMRRGLISGAELVAVVSTLPRFTTATVVCAEAPGGAR